jgi:hypothetical protein
VDIATARREQDHHFKPVGRQTELTDFQYAEVFQTPGRSLTYVDIQSGKSYGNPPTPDPSAKRTDQ